MEPITPAISAALEYASSFAIPVSFGPVSMPIARKPLMATCTLVHSGENQWLLTAWHVLKEIVAELQNSESVCHLGINPSNMDLPLATIFSGHHVGDVSYSERLDIATIQAPAWLLEVVDNSTRYRVLRPSRWPLLPRVMVGEQVYLAGHPTSSTIIAEAPIRVLGGKQGKLFTLQRTSFGMRVRSVTDVQFMSGPVAAKTEPEELAEGLDVGGVSGGPVFVERVINGVSQLSLCGVVVEGAMFDQKWLGTFVCAHVNSLQPDGSIDEDAPQDPPVGVVILPRA